VLQLALTPGAIGIAEAALAAFQDRLPGRLIAYTLGEKQIESATTHRQLADASTRVRVARLLLHRAVDDIEAAAAAGVMMAPRERARIRMDCAHAVAQCREAVETLFLACGGSGIAETSPVQRAWRDLHAIAMHGALAYEVNQEMFGRMLLGLTPNTTFQLLSNGAHVADLTTNAAVVKMFLDREITIEGEEGATGVVRSPGMRYNGRTARR